MNQLTFNDITVNPSVADEDLLRLSKHCWLMYNLLLEGPATNVELADCCHSMNPTARRTDLRQALQKIGKGLVITERGVGGHRGVNRYALKG